jgi:hypothetical protein
MARINRDHPSDIPIKRSRGLADPYDVPDDEPPQPPAKKHRIGLSAQAQTKPLKSSGLKRSVSASKPGGNPQSRDVWSGRSVHNGTRSPAALGGNFGLRAPLVTMTSDVAGSHKNQIQKAATGNTGNASKVGYRAQEMSYEPRRQASAIPVENTPTARISEAAAEATFTWPKRPPPLPLEPDHTSTTLGSGFGNETIRPPVETRYIRPRPPPASAPAPAPPPPLPFVPEQTALNHGSNLGNETAHDRVEAGLIRSRPPIQATLPIPAAAPDRTLRISDMLQNGPQPMWQRPVDSTPRPQSAPGNRVITDDWSRRNSNLSTSTDWERRDNAMSTGSEWSGRASISDSLPGGDGHTYEMMRQEAAYRPPPRLLVAPIASMLGVHAEPPLTRRPSAAESAVVNTMKEVEESINSNRANAAAKIVADTMGVQAEPSLSRRSSGAEKTVRYSFADYAVEEHKVVGSPVVRGLRVLRPLQDNKLPSDPPQQVHPTVSFDGLVATEVPTSRSNVMSADMSVVTNNPPSDLATQAPSTASSENHAVAEVPPNESNAIGAETPFTAGSHVVQAGGEVQAQPEYTSNKSQNQILTSTNHAEVNLKVLATPLMASINESVDHSQHGNQASHVRAERASIDTAGILTEEPDTAYRRETYREIERMSVEISARILASSNQTGVEAKDLAAVLTTTITHVANDTSALNHGVGIDEEEVVKNLAIGNTPRTILEHKTAESNLNEPEPTKPTVENTHHAPESSYEPDIEILHNGHNIEIHMEEAPRSSNADKEDETNFDDHTIVAAEEQPAPTEGTAEATSLELESSYNTGRDIHRNIHSIELENIEALKLTMKETSESVREDYNNIDIVMDSTELNEVVAEKTELELGITQEHGNDIHHSIRNPDAAMQEALVCADVSILDDQIIDIAVEQPERHEKIAGKADLELESSHAPEIAMDDSDNWETEIEEEEDDDDNTLIHTPPPFPFPPPNTRKERKYQHDNNPSTKGEESVSEGQHDTKIIPSANSVRPVEIGVAIFEEPAPDAAEQNGSDYLQFSFVDEMRDAPMEATAPDTTKQNDTNYIHDGLVPTRVPNAVAITPEPNTTKPTQDLHPDSARQKPQADGVSESVDIPIQVENHSLDTVHDETKSETSSTSQLSDLSDLVETFMDPDAGNSHDTATWSGGREVDYIRGHRTNPEGKLEYLVKWKTNSRSWKSEQDLLIFALGQLYAYCRSTILEKVGPEFVVKRPMGRPKGSRDKEQRTRRPPISGVSRPVKTRRRRATRSVATKASPVKTKMKRADRGRNSPDAHDETPQGAQSDGERAVIKDPWRTFATDTSMSRVKSPGKTQQNKAALEGETIVEDDIVQDDDPLEDETSDEKGSAFETSEREVAPGRHLRHPRRNLRNRKDDNDDLPEWETFIDGDDVPQDDAAEEEGEKLKTTRRLTRGQGRGRGKGRSQPTRRVNGDQRGYPTVSDGVTIDDDAESPISQPTKPSRKPRKKFIGWEYIIENENEDDTEDKEDTASEGSQASTDIRRGPPRRSRNFTWRDISEGRTLSRGATVDNEDGTPQLAANINKKGKQPLRKQTSALRKVATPKVEEVAGEPSDEEMVATEDDMDVDDSRSDKDNEKPQQRTPKSKKQAKHPLRRQSAPDNDDSATEDGMDIDNSPAPTPGTDRRLRQHRSVTRREENLLSWVDIDLSGDEELGKSTKPVAPNRVAKSISGVTARKGHSVSRGTSGGRGGRRSRGGARPGAGRNPSAIRGGKTRGLKVWESQMAARLASRKNSREERQASHIYSISSDESVREEHENRSGRDSHLPSGKARARKAALSPLGRRRPTAQSPVETRGMEQQRTSARSTSSAPNPSMEKARRKPSRPKTNPLPPGLTSTGASGKAKRDRLQGRRRL